jgi:uncharacterized protein (DUF427 family)
MENQATPSPAPGFQTTPRYHMTIQPSTSLHQLMFNETLVAASNRAIIVDEQNLIPVIYFPRADILVDLTPAETPSTHCPFKGHARYWTLESNGKQNDQAGWSYDTPYIEAAPLHDHIAFALKTFDCYWRDGTAQPLAGPGRLKPSMQQSDCHHRQAA